jgi:hypothetical protein
VQPLLMLFNTTRSTCCVLLLFNARTPIPTQGGIKWSTIYQYHVY